MGCLAAPIAGFLHVHKPEVVNEQAHNKRTGPHPLSLPEPDPENTLLEIMLPPLPPAGSTNTLSLKTTPHRAGPLHRDKLEKLNDN